MPNVAYKHPSFVSLQPRWALINDAIEGETAIKKGREKYLPRPNAADTSDAANHRYTAYITRAMFYNATGHTHRGLVGQVFTKETQKKVAPLLDKLVEDANGGNVSLDGLARKVLGRVLAFGRCGLLADYPVTSGPQTMRDVEMGNVRPTISCFDPWDVINWRVEQRGAKQALTLVVIREMAITSDDGFEQKATEYFRVLRLTPEGVYVVEIWEMIKDKADYAMVSQFVPTDGSGKTWSEIPFIFVGSENNDPEPDSPPMYDLASLNIAHYRNSADYEESCFMCGQPTPVFTGMTQKWVDEVLKGGVQLGSRTAVCLPVGANAELLQATANSMPFEAMQHKERQMVALGAKLVEQKFVQRTATESGIDEAVQTSILESVAMNVSSAFTQMLKHCARFLGQNEDECEYSISTDFAAARMQPQELAALIAAWQSRAIAFDELRENLRRGGIAYMETDEVVESLENDPLSFGLPADGQAEEKQPNNKQEDTE